MKNPKLDVLGLGTCNTDFLMNVSRFSCADDEVDIEKLRISLGGSAANGTNWKRSIRRIYSIGV
jgi:ribokinase